MFRTSFRTATAGLILTVLVALAAGGCRDLPVQPDPGPVSSPTVAPVSSPTVAPVSSPTVAPASGPVAFHVRLGAGQALTTRSPAPDHCPGLDALIDLG